MNKKQLLATIIALGIIAGVLLPLLDPMYNLEKYKNLWWNHAFEQLLITIPIIVCYAIVYFLLRSVAAQRDGPDEAAQRTRPE